MPKQPTEIDIESLDPVRAGGSGGMHNERPVWVRNALPGETVRARILKRRGGQRFADGQPLENFSTDRVPSPVRIFLAVVQCDP